MIWMFAQTTTHATLLARVSACVDPDAWEEFCARYESLIRDFARRRGVVGADADDVVQDVLIALTKSMPGFQYDPARGKFRSYLKTVVLRSIFRKSSRGAGEVSLDQIDEALRGAADDPLLDEAWEQDWRQYHVRQAMRTLESEFNAADRHCFVAYVVQGDDAAAVAGRYGMSLDQVYQAKHRMLKRLRAVIAAQVEEEG